MLCGWGKSKKNIPMKKIFNLLFILFISINAFGFATDTIYINRTGTIVSRDSARFYRIVSKVDSNQFKIEDFYLTGQLQMLAFNSSPIEVVRKGKYIFYDSLGFVSSEGEYHLGNKIGEWVNYYFGTKNIKTIRTFKNNQKGYSLKAYDSITHNLRLEGEYDNSLNRTGIFKEYYSRDNKILATTNYLNNIKEGDAKEYYNSGEIKRVEFYEIGKLKKGELFDRNGEKQKYYPYQEDAKLNESVYECLIKNIKEYKKTKKVNNLVLKYTITKFSNLINVEVLENDKPELNTEIINAISKIKVQKPAKKENQPIDATIILRFKKTLSDSE